MSAAIEQNKVVEKQDQTDMPAFENISIENATYLQNLENTPNFEVDSIELASPQLFSEDEEINSLNNENKEEPKIFERPVLGENSDDPKPTLERSATQEPEMFESHDSEDDLEIPAFLRRQKN